MKISSNIKKKIVIVIPIIIVILTTLYIIFNYKETRILSYLALLPVIILPILINKIINLDDNDILIYYIFIFFSYFIGCIVNLYNTTKYYDSIIHMASGIYTFYIAFKIINKNKTTNGKILKILFCFGFVFLIAGLWEIGEFSCDSLLHTNLQHSRQTGVYDTMTDIISATLGSVIAYIASIRNLD